MRGVGERFWCWHWCWVVWGVMVFWGMGLACGEEVQSHGLVFERWICDAFFEGYRPAVYTGKWDIPGAVNRERGGIPVNPKAAKWKTPVDMGDALRQFDIDEPFWLVIGYWRQREEWKEMVWIFARRVEVEEWRRLWSPIRREDLERLDALIKDRGKGVEEVRREAKEMKGRKPFSEAVMQVNPKIDSGEQRRLQCSLRFSDVVKLAGGKEPVVGEERVSLWGKEFPNPIFSKPRKLRTEKN